MHHSTPGVQTRAVHDFGRNLVANCKSELIGHFSARDIDDVADQILAKASNAFLDKALEMRLATIDAKPLLNALAKAERLGYDSQDLVEVSHGEHVIPNSHTGHMPAPNMGPSVPAPAVGSDGSRAAHLNELQCMRCYRTFTQRSHFDYVRCPSQTTAIQILTFHVSIRHAVSAQRYPRRPMALDTPAQDVVRDSPTLGALPTSVSGPSDTPYGLADNTPSITHIQCVMVAQIHRASRSRATSHLLRFQCGIPRLQHIQLWLRRPPRK